MIMVASNKISVVAEAQKLVEVFEKKLQQNLQTDKFMSSYNSLDDILVTKYHLRNIENIDSPDYRNKTEFITKNVRGNLQKAEGNILSYKEAEGIVEKAIDEELP